MYSVNGSVFILTDAFDEAISDCCSCDLSFGLLLAFAGNYSDCSEKLYDGFS